MVPTAKHHPPGMAHHTHAPTDGNDIARRFDATKATMDRAFGSAGITT
jgi:hypothetical protein